MIVNDRNEVIAWTMLPRDIGLEALFFLPCQSIHLFSVFLHHYLEWNITERNGTEWNGTEQNGTEKQTTQFFGNINDPILINDQRT